MPSPWWRSRWVRWPGAVVLVVVVVGGLLLADAATRSDDDGEGWARTGAEVLAFDSPSGDRDPTGTVSVAYRVGSSEIRADIETRYEDFGPTVDVEYDPDSPADVRIAGEERREGGIVSTVVFVVVTGIGLAAVAAALRAVTRWLERATTAPTP